MIKKVFNISLLFGLMLLLLVSCLKEEKYPIVPEIGYKDFVLLLNNQTGIVERGVMTITFKDGDGDIGLLQEETEPPYDYNLFVKYFEIQNKDTVEVILTEPETGDTINFHSRIPILTPKGTNKSISGEIEDTLFVYNPNSEFDTIMYEVYLVDRALHKSNIIQTPLILRSLHLK